MKGWLTAVWILGLSAVSTAVLLGVAGPIGVGREASFPASAVSAAMVFFADLGVLLVTLGAWRRRGLHALLLLVVPFILAAGAAAGCQGGGLELGERFLRALGAALLMGGVLGVGLGPLVWFWRDNQDS